MATKQKSRQLKITISDELYGQLSEEAKRRSQNISSVVESILETYTEQFDMTLTQTWQLCGMLTITEPDPEYVVATDEAEPMTNYAEHVDDILYQG